MRRLVPAAAIVAAILPLAACAPPPPPTPMTWSKPGASYDAFLKDRYACIGDARTVRSGGFIYGRMGAASSQEVLSGQIYLPCMAAHGWQRDPAGYGPPPGGVIVLR
jgi:hypothetical protein